VQEDHPVPISIDEAISRLTFLPDRTPTGVDEEYADAFERLADYRDGAIFVGHWAGRSEWERRTTARSVPTDLWTATSALRPT
jgi:hypothetical protein